MKRGSPTRVVQLATLALVAFAAAGCEFGTNKAAPAMNMNSCLSPTDCGVGSSCVDGLCISDSSEPLSLVLRVTPPQLLDGSPALPINLPRITFKGPGSYAGQMLPHQSSYYPTVTNGGQPIAAQLTFSPETTIPGVQADIMHALVDASTPAEFNVKLLSQKDFYYDMLVQPNDSQLPPDEIRFRPGPDREGRADYPLDGTTSLVLNLSGVPSDRTLVVRAFNAMTGNPASSLGTISANGRVMLELSPNVMDYWLDIRASRTTAPSDATNATDAMTAEPCDLSSASFPTFRVNRSDLSFDTDGTANVALPEPPGRVRYQGTVELCKGIANPDPAVLGKLPLPVTLHSRSLHFADASPVTASFDATTNATYDEASGKLRFCVQAFPGQYQVLASPPPSVGCALYAADRLIAAPAGSEAATGTELQLPDPAYVESKVLTDGLQPIAGATVQALALGRASDPQLVDLPSDQVTSFNRSQQTATDRNGSFRLPLDVGSYDIIVQPPGTSGFPWRVSHDVPIGSSSGSGVTFSTMITMLPPVALSGTLTAEQDSTAPAVGGARIDAFAMIPNQPSGERAIQIGQATADDTGYFTLLLPGSIEDKWW